MIINSRIKGLIEMDAVLRKAERTARQTGSFDDQARYAVHRIRSGESAHEVMRPHVDAYVSASRTLNNVHRAQARTSHRGHSPDVIAASRARDEAHRNLHNFAGAIGRHAGEFLTPEHTAHMNSRAPSLWDHIHTVAQLHGAHTTNIGGGYTPGGHAFRAHFHTPEDASTFHKVAQNVFPHLSPSLETNQIVRMHDPYKSEPA